jgi:outer membrane protein assembly factor BamB
MPNATFNNNIICLGQKGDKSIVYCLQGNNGKVLWKWSDIFLSNEVFFISRSLHLSNNNLVIKNASKTYIINMETGSTIWRTITQYNGGFNGTGTKGIANLFFFFGGQGAALYGNIEKQQEFLYRVVTPQQFGEIASVYLPTPFIDDRSDTILITPINRFNNITNTGKTYISLYNFSQRKELYSTACNPDTSIWNDGGTYGLPIVWNSRIFITVNTSILCHDLRTGKALWRRDFPADFGFAGITLANGKIIGNCENEIMYALDPETGATLWQEPSSGTSSTPFVMNGVIYLAGGGDGMFHAIDADTGKHIWRIASPEAQRGVYFFDHVTGADGRVFVSSRTTMYCYKAAR